MTKKWSNIWWWYWKSIFCWTISSISTNIQIS